MTFFAVVVVPEKDLFYPLASAAPLRVTLNNPLAVRSPTDRFVRGAIKQNYVNKLAAERSKSQ